jgi:hypothetical protein
MMIFRKTFKQQASPASVDFLKSFTPVDLTILLGGLLGWKKT